MSGCARSLQGHFQIVLSVEHCPLFQKELPVLMRIMYCFGVWSYVVGAITAPVFIAIPLVTIWAGVFPIVVSWWAAGACADPASQHCTHQISWFDPPPCPKASCVGLLCLLLHFTCMQAEVCA